MGKIVELTTVNNPVYAHILQGKLQNAGINALIFDEFMTVLYASAINGGARIMVNEEDLEKALKIYRNFNITENEISKKLIVFDLDGTLLNSLEDLADSANHILEDHGYPTHPVDAYRYFVGDGVTKLVERILPEKERNEQNIELCKRDFIEYYDIHKEDKTTAYKGLYELLADLKRRGIKIAVATNKVHEAVEPLMQKYYPGIEFDAILGQRKGCPVKPDPTIMNDILKITGCSAEETYHVGDTATDIKLAQNAGVESVGVTWGYRPKSELEDADATFIIDNPQELLELV